MSLFSRLFRKPPAAPAHAAPADPAPPQGKDLLDLLIEGLHAAGIEATRDGEFAVLASDIGIACKFGGSREHPGRVGAMTCTVTSHPVHFPDGVTEFQNSQGETLEEALRSGFEMWAKVDLALLELIVNDKVSECMSMQLGFPMKDGSTLTRQVVFGGTAHFADDSKETEEAEEHPFCPCCLFTNSLEALKPEVEQDRFLGIRLFAARDTDGAAQSDFRINGEDFEPGRDALKHYVASWPERGLEFRKQYVVVRTIPTPPN